MALQVLLERVSDLGGMVIGALGLPGAKVVLGNREGDAPLGEGGCYVCVR